VSSVLTAINTTASNATTMITAKLNKTSRNVELNFLP
jgi:hypothetical protein